MFPRVAFELFSKTTQNIVSKYLYGGVNTDLKEYLMRRTLKICVCNSFPRSKEEISHIVAFLGPRRSMSSSCESLWIISRVESLPGNPSRRRRNCITEKSYVLSFCGDGSYSEPAVLYRFQPDINFSLVRLSNGTFVMFEMSVTDQELLQLKWSNNQGMKCRCENNSSSLLDISRRQCYGTMVISQKSPSHYQSIEYRMKFGKVIEKVSSTARIFPKVGDSRAIRAIDEKLRSLDGVDFMSKSELLRSHILFFNNFIFGWVLPHGEDSMVKDWTAVSEDFGSVDLMRMDVESQNSQRKV